MNFWDIIIATGIIQALVIGFVILFNKNRNRVASNTLATILFMCALAFIGVLADKMYDSSIHRVVTNLEPYMPFYFTMLLGPMIYFHVKSFALENYRIEGKDYWHLSPVLINFIPTFLNLSLLLSQKFNFSFLEESTVNGLVDDYYTYGDALFWAHFSCYLLLAKRLFNSIKGVSKNITQTYLISLRRFLTYFLVFQVLWLPFLLVYISDYRYLIWENGLYYYPIYIPLVILIYWISFKYFTELHAYGLIGKFRKSSILLALSEQQISEAVVKLRLLMDAERMYLNPNLSVKDIADRLTISSRLLSALLNQHLKTNFNDFINEYRVNHVKKMLIDPKYSHLTIASLALDSGFNSIPTFQRTFKAFTKCSPVNYKKQAVLV